MKDTEQLFEQVGEARESATRLMSSMKNAASLVKRVAREQLEQRPYATLGAAAGAGFVLAGGIASKLARTAFKAGAVAAVGKIAKDMVERVQAGELSHQPQDQVGGAPTDQRMSDEDRERLRDPMRDAIAEGKETKSSTGEPVWPEATPTP